MLLLAGDVGGTKVNLAFVSTDSGPKALLHEATFPSQDYADLEAIIDNYVDDTGLRPERACIGIAGPIVDGRVVTTNIPWIIDSRDLARRLGLASVSLINDLQAISYSIPALGPEDLHTLNEGQPAEHGAIAVIAPGTGLGEGYMTWSGNRYVAHPSEGGHIDFAPLDELQHGLLRYLMAKFGHVSYERVASGVGIPNIFRYLYDSGLGRDEDQGLLTQILNAKDPTPLIVDTGLNHPDKSTVCRQAFEVFLSVLGAATGNLALTVLARGGIYLGGGIPPRILPALQRPEFLATIQDKGRLGYVVKEMPVKVILNAKAGLIGAAACGLSERRVP